MNNKIKLISIIIFSTFILFIKDIFIITTLLFVSIALSFRFNNKYRISDRLKPLLFVTLMVVSFQLIFNSSLSFSNRLLLGILTSEKIILLSMSIFIYTLTTSLSDIIDSLSFLPRKICLMLTITLSLIPAIIEESKKITVAQQSRGHSFTGINFYQTIIPVIIPLMHRTLGRAQQLSMVLIARGYEA